jgi:anti-sigma regulatory factor (Ser/Thr protein kinase)
VDSLLIPRWTACGDAIPVIDQASVSSVRDEVRRRGAAAGLPPDVTARLALVATELATNQLRHAAGGYMLVCPIARHGTAGLEIVAADSGGGLLDPSAALAGGWSTKGSLGLGVSSVHRMSDELDIDVRVGEGTCVRARAYASPVARGPEIGIFGRPMAGERVSGDDGALARDGDVVSVAVSDGLGHGPFAREASRAAIDAFLAENRLGCGRSLEAADLAVDGLRGAVMGVARLDEHLAELESATAGNITTILVARDRSRRAVGRAMTLGVRSAMRRRFPVERFSMDRRDVLVMFTDGLTSRLSLDGETELLTQHPIVIAEHLCRVHARDNDDALVLVVRR